MRVEDVVVGDWIAVDWQPGLREDLRPPTVIDYEVVKTIARPGDEGTDGQFVLTWSDGPTTTGVERTLTVAPGTSVERVVRPS